MSRTNPLAEDPLWLGLGQHELAEFASWLRRHGSPLSLRGAAAAAWRVTVATQRWAGYMAELGDGEPPQVKRGSVCCC